MKQHDSNARGSREDRQMTDDTSYFKEFARRDGTRGRFMPVFTYHRLSEPGDIRSRFDFSSVVFNSHLEALAAAGIRCVVPEDLSGAGAQAAMDRAVMITFDDGYESDYHTALPALARFGFKAVTFITANLVGRPGYLTWDKIRELADAGFSVQSHSLNHRFLTTLDAKELSVELKKSKEAIEDKVGAKVNYVAAPGGRVSGVVVRAAAEAGYAGIFNSKPGYAISRESSIFVFNRFVLKNTITLPEFARISRQDRLALFKASAAYSVKNLIRKTLGKP